MQNIKIKINDGWKLSKALIESCMDCQESLIYEADDIIRNQCGEITVYTDCPDCNIAKALDDN